MIICPECKKAMFIRSEYDEFNEWFVDCDDCHRHINISDDEVVTQYNRLVCLSGGNDNRTKLLEELDDQFKQIDTLKTKLRKARERINDLKGLENVDYRGRFEKAMTAYRETKFLLDKFMGFIHIFDEMGKTIKTASDEIIDATEIVKDYEKEEYDILEKTIDKLEDVRKNKADVFLTANKINETIRFIKSYQKSVNTAPFRKVVMNKTDI